MKRKLFKNPSLIHKNTPEILEKLEELGYYLWSCYEDEPVIIATSFNFKIQSQTLPNEIEPVVITSQEETIDDFIDQGYIDCGENENLFLAIASLCDTSDLHQWFVNDEGKWYYNDIENPIYIDTLMDEGGFHKATLEELIEHFK